MMPSVLNTKCLKMCAMYNILGLTHFTLNQLLAATTVLSVYKRIRFLDIVVHLKHILNMARLNNIVNDTVTCQNLISHINRKP